MFWDTVVMADALKSAETHIGPVGRYIENPESHFSGAKLYTKQAGIFWYGDIELELMANKKLVTIARELGEDVYVLPDDGISESDAFAIIQPLVA